MGYRATFTSELDDVGPGNYPDPHLCQKRQISNIYFSDPTNVGIPGEQRVILTSRATQYLPFRYLPVLHHSRLQLSLSKIYPAPDYFWRLICINSSCSQFSALMPI